MMNSGGYGYPASAGEYGHAPPTNFPPRVTVRFDVQAETEPVLQ